LNQCKSEAQLQFKPILFILLFSILIANTINAQVNFFTETSQNTTLLTSGQIQKLNKVSAENYESTKIIEVKSLEEMASSGKITVDITGEVCGIVEFNATNVVFKSTNDYYWYGEMVSKSDCDCNKGYLSLTKTSEGLMGSVQIETNIYIIQDLGGGKQVLGKVPQSYTGSCGGATPQFQEPTTIEERGPTENCDIRVLILATPEAMSSTGNFGLLVSSDFNKANQILQNSAIPSYAARLVLAGVLSTEGYFSENSKTFQTVLLEVSNNSTAISNRNIFGADIVVLYVRESIMDNSSTAGIAYLGGRWAVIQSSGSDNGLVFAHEVGHILKANHELCTELSPGTGCMASDGLVAHAHTFNTGKKCKEKLRKTVLYSVSGNDIVPFYSNPLVGLDGAVTGVTNESNNASMIRGFACTASNHSTLFQDQFDVNIKGEYTGCPNATVLLQAILQGTGIGAIAYAWRKSSDGINYGSVISTASEYNLVLPSTLGTTTFIKVTATNAQGQTKTAFFHVTVANSGLCGNRSISDNSIKTGIAFPNPSEGYVNLLIPKGDTDGKLQITDLSGKSVHFENEISETEDGIQLQIRIPLIYNGVYFYQYRSKDNQYAGKIVINK
jgi:hypothetical protein